MTGTETFKSEEVRKMLGVSKDTFFRAVKNGSIPSIKLSERKCIYPKKMILAWLEGRQKDLAASVAGCAANSEVDRNEIISKQ